MAGSTRPASRPPAPVSAAPALTTTPYRFRRSVIPAALRALADEFERQERVITVEGHSEPLEAA